MSARNRNRLGFTLVELMFSLTIGTLLLLLSAGLIGVSGVGYSRTSGGVAIDREGRALVDRLAADLASAVMVEGAVLDSNKSDFIAFVTLLPAAAQSDDGRVGDACTVSYRIADLETGGRVRRCLMRSVRESGETLAMLRAGETGVLFAGKFPVEEPLAFDVVEFKSLPKSMAIDGTWQDWTNQSGERPDALEITWVLARPGVARRMKTVEDWDTLAAGEGISRSEDLEIQTATHRFGNHARP